MEPTQTQMTIKEQSRRVSLQEQLFAAEGTREQYAMVMNCAIIARNRVPDLLSSAQWAQAIRVKSLGARRSIP